MKKSDKQLLVELFHKLPDEQGRQLLEFAEFLVSRLPSPQPAQLEPVEIPRPAEESVIAAVKRLSATYHMLDKDKMLNDTSLLVTQHLIHGREAVEVIDELEEVFRRFYETHKNENQPG